MSQNIAPLCPTCGKTMRLTGIAPTCVAVTYEYRCDNDGDALDWRPQQRVTPDPLQADMHAWPRASNQTASENGSSP